MTIPIISIVEGHGEVEAVPLLLRRLGLNIRPHYWVDAPYPIRVPRDKLLKSGQLERYFQFAAAQAVRGGVLILVDAEDPDSGCPAMLGPGVHSRTSAVRNDIPTLVVIAKNEYEAWFLAAAESLRGERGLRSDIEPPIDPEAIRGAKEWIQDRMGEGHRYSETVDQPALTALFDLQAARRSASFDRFYCRFGDFCDKIAQRAEL
jgi:hypothetical protein